MTLRELEKLRQAYRGFKWSLKSRIHEKFNGICQSCSRRGVLKRVNGKYLQTYERGMRSWRGKLVPFEVHHIVPLSAGGTNDENNLTLLCRPCHRTEDVRRRRSVAESDNQRIGA